VPLDIPQDWFGRRSERRRPDEIGAVIENPRAGGTIDVAALYGDLDIDRAVQEDFQAGNHQIDLVRPRGDRAAEQRGQRNQ
jgi:hypothetical protein